MSDAVKMMYTSKLLVEFNPSGVDLAVQFLLVQTTKPIKLNRWFENANVIAIHRLKYENNQQPKKGKNPVRYLVMRKKSEKKIDDDPEILSQSLNYMHLRKNGITDDLILMMLFKSVVQCDLQQDNWENKNPTNKLFLTKPGWDKKNSQVALEVQVKNRILMLKSRTFSKKSGTSGYVVRNLGRCLKFVNGKQGTYLIQKSAYRNQKNLTDFFTLKELDKFHETKSSIFNDLLEKVRMWYPDCFKQGPSCQPFELSHDTGMVRVMKIEHIWNLLRGRSLNVVADKAQSAVYQFATTFVQYAQKSPLLRDKGVEVHLTSKITDGLNLQILFDLQDPRYQVSQGKKVVQHLTICNFGGYRPDEKEFHWFPTTDELLNDPKVRMTLYQLLIKQDLLTHVYQVPSLDDLACAAQYRYLTFKIVDANRVKVLRQTILSSGHLQFESQVVQLNAEPKDSDNLGKIVKQIWQANHGENYRLLGAVQAHKQIYAIYNTDLVTLPNISQIQHHMELSNPGDFVLRQNLIQVAKRLEVVKQRDILNKHNLLNDLKTIDRSQIKKSQLKTYIGLSWQTKVMKQFNDLFYQTYNHWLHLPIKQKKYSSIWRGTYGMGMVKIEGEFYYFVGRNQIINQTLAHAVTLKRLVVLNSQQPQKAINRVIDQFESMMQVGFVRDNQYTVIPFPFKYNREYAEMINHFTE